MNPAQPRIVTLKASSQDRKLRQRLHLAPTIAARLFTFPVRNSLGWYTLQQHCLTWFEVIGYTVLLQSDIDCVRHPAQRYSNSEVILRDRLLKALQRINPTIPLSAIADTISQLTAKNNCLLVENNRRYHKLLTDGIEISYPKDGQIVNDQLWLLDPLNLHNNDWLVIHPCTIVEGNYTHNLDVVVFINGIPLAVIVWTDPNNQKTSLKQAYQRLQVYKQQIPTLFTYNAFVVIACGSQARVGTVTSDWQEFLPWHSIDGEDFSATGETELEIVIQGIFDKRRCLELVKHFIVFEEKQADINKKLLRHHFCTRLNRFCCD
ncbi:MULTISPECIES: type I restriction endonuclease [unclassified Tolypothrix]|uniref:type I restriction endonuclease n=1 Tax=unclassified Tolypothrix TaxID=2649714 RepID=UPI0005EAA5C9|nr:MULTISPECIES: type I restriction endonuclease [unclassified Tolypothrix]BAY91179.1 type I site-specific deoxyribonuclease chain R [Microchaete diplosiphon NIES-3275]EKE99888.1 typeI site-specific deoxyribonuclease [Tolypothrix sp. PCC 7601]MBE9085584.1 type I restriction endonuclease subunit R [Tolypothrix sp. LEGE 11397]UYD25263.1 type I restriction endonuclease subunit R [Tolypothrix sp. PCC 7712]UYD32497.1 type I restriction endonuclease subunit R [Tolypothrix sp. PCC 7601]